MRYTVSTEDPAFATDFEHFVQQGADPELVAMMAPLLRGEDSGGSAAATQEAGQFLHRQSLFSRVRDPRSLVDARREAFELLTRFGEQVDMGLIRKYAPSKERIEQALDERFPNRGAQPFELPDRPQQPSDAARLIEQDREPGTYTDYGPRPFWEFQ